ncbi:MAG: porin [Stagnimonas sp.]|nr:porin [Stagnimonas sp.]
MSNTLKVAALAVLAVAAGNVYADPAETKGGIKIKTEDGRFEANVNGRIQFDYYSFSEDQGAVIGTAPFGTAVVANGANRGGAAFRRTYLTLSGKAYGWDYKFENDFTTTAANGGSFREMWIGTSVGPGKLIIGQHKPFRGMEEMASSNEITLIERPNTTATGIYAGRQFLTGLFYKGNTDTFGYGVHATTLAAATAQTEGHSFGGRAYWFPMSEDGRTLHVGLAYSSDREDAGSAGAAPVFQYGGRRGISLGLGNAGAVTGSGFGTQSTIHGELAGSFGSFTAQGEYAMATLEDGFGTAAAPSDIDVTAYYVQASYFITGEKKVYKKDRGAFGAPKPINSYGAVEAVVRYEASENDETTTGAARGCSLGGVAAGSYQTCEGSQITVGANWYVNPNVRFMANYYLASADVGAGKDEPEAITVRAQMSF